VFADALVQPEQAAPGVIQSPNRISQGRSRSLDLAIYGVRPILLCLADRPGPTPSVTMVIGLRPAQGKSILKHNDTGTKRSCAQASWFGRKRHVCERKPVHAACGAAPRPIGQAGSRAYRRAQSAGIYASFIAKL